MSSENLKIWKAVEKTDEKYTKRAKKGQHNFTSISPVFQFKQVTAVFGPYGKGWGVVIGSETFESVTIGETILLNYDAVFFYEGGKFPIHATEKLAYKTQGASGYLKIDDEARKKVVTNAITKGLSMLGVSADIFMGLFDDAEYMAQIRMESDIEKADDRDAAISEKQQEHIEYVTNNQRGIGGAASKSAANGILRVSVAHLQRRSSTPEIQNICIRGIEALKETYNEKFGDEK